MNRNRISTFYGKSSEELSSKETPMSQMKPIPSTIISTQHDIFMAAHEKAKKEFELNRLFNPDYYRGSEGN